MTPIKIALLNNKLRNKNLREFYTQQIKQTKLKINFFSRVHNVDDLSDSLAKKLHEFNPDFIITNMRKSNSLYIFRFLRKLYENELTKNIPIIIISYAVRDDSRTKNYLGCPNVIGAYSLVRQPPDLIELLKSLVLMRENEIKILEAMQKQLGENKNEKDKI